MSRKGFLVKVELDIQAVTCPGVWLCSNGKVSLQLFMLDSCIQTKSGKPLFPVRFHEKFVFYKTFTTERRLSDLQKRLNHEWLYVELIQWQTCEEGCVLATFQTTLDDLLYPPSYRGSVAGVDLDLLMEPTKLFPGSIAPKLEVCTKTTIEETLCDMTPKSLSSVVVNPKLLMSAQPSKKCRPRKVCHSIAYSRARKTCPSLNKKTKPVFKYQKVNEDEIYKTYSDNKANNFVPHPLQRKYNGEGDNLVRRSYRYTEDDDKTEDSVPCYCSEKSRCTSKRSSRASHRKPDSPSITVKSKHHLQRERPCECQVNVKESYCPICSKYEGYFASLREAKNATRRNNLYSTPAPQYCPYCEELKKNRGIYRQCGSADLSDASDKRKICSCVPQSRKSSLAQHLHEKLSRTLETNSRYLRSCIDCDDLT